MKARSKARATATLTVIKGNKKKDNWFKRMLNKIKGG